MCGRKRLQRVHLEIILSKFIALCLTDATSQLASTSFNPAVFYVRVQAWQRGLWYGWRRTLRCWRSKDSVLFEEKTGNRKTDWNLKPGYSHLMLCILHWWCLLWRGCPLVVCQGLHVLLCPSETSSTSSQ